MKKIKKLLANKKFKRNKYNSRCCKMSILTEQKINELKEQLENNKSFQYWKKEDGLSFEDFDIVDLDSNMRLHNGKKDIGNFCLYLKDGAISKALYDLSY